MTGTLIQIFRNATAASSVRDNLLAMGIQSGDIHLICSPADPACAPAQDEPERDIIADLSKLGVPTARAELYLNEVNNGRALIVVMADDAKRAEIEHILGSDLSRRDTGIREAAMKGQAMGAMSTSDTPNQSMSNQPMASQGLPNQAISNQAMSNQADELREQVVQEDLLVGKRQVETGGVRITAHTTETPVDQQVSLHEEHVEVQRRPVDRPANQSDFGRNLGAKDEVIEFRESHEEPVVSKRARVVEEVVIRKTASDHTENVHDTVRRRDVDIQPIRKGDSSSTPDLSKHEPDFRRSFDENMTESGYTYEQLNPAYEYGANLASDEKYKGKRWEDVEGSARNEWESRNPGTWERIKSAVQHSWEKIGRADEPRD